MEPYPYKHAAIFANEVAATNVADRAGRRGRRPLQQAEKRRFPASAGRSPAKRPLGGAGAFN